MSDYILSCCSTADMSRDFFKSRNINYLCFHFSVNGKIFTDDLGESYPFKKFYGDMANGAETKTSQPNVDDYLNYFEGLLKNEHKDILHITLSSGLSGAFNSATIAANDLKEKYPDRKIYVIDSLGASSGYGLFMERLATLRDEGMGIDELRDWAEKNRLRLHHWFFSTDLTFYVKGGRVSKSSGWFGTVLRICPLLNMDYMGKLIPREKIRTKKKAIAEIVDKMEQNAVDGLNYSEKCFISNSDCINDAMEVAALVEERFPKLNGKVTVESIGTTIGSHTGPGTVALFFWGENSR